MSSCTVDPSYATCGAPYSPPSLSSAVSRATPAEVSLARTHADLTDAFRLLYTSYLSAGITQPNAAEMRITPYHLQPTTEVFVAKYNNEVISTLTMTAESQLGLPMESMYREELAKLRTQMVVAEMGCLADRRHSPVRFVKVFAELARLVVQVARQRGIEALVLAAHPRHAKFYSRTLGFEQFGDLTSCPYAQGNPAIAMVMHFDSLRGTEIYDRLFGEAIPAAELERTPWGADTASYLQTLYQWQQYTTGRSRIAG